MAINVFVAPPDGTLAVVGDTFTTIAGGAVTVIVAAADLLLSATDVAVKVTIPAGTEAGAVYMMATPVRLEVGETTP